MRWVVGKILALFLWPFFIVASVVKLTTVIARMVIRTVVRGFRITIRLAASWHEEITRFRQETKKIAADLPRFADEQRARNPLDPDKKTVFLLITCGQAVRNFLLSQVLDLLRHRFNVVILSPYAYADEFRARYAKPGTHVLPWFESFRSIIERFFQYYLMSKSGSRTHQSWLKNLEARARTDGGPLRRTRLLKHIALRRASDLVGALVGVRGMQALYHIYFLAYLPRTLFKRLFSTYRPALVISTTAHHAEAWPLTYFARRYGCKTLANILSWDNPTTKAAMDTSCDYYAVWSDDMKRELAAHFPYVKTQAIVTGSPMFDMYYNKRGALERATFLNSVGLSPDRPYILYTTNTPAGMPDECEIVARYWSELNRTKLADKVSLMVRLHPKEDLARYQALRDQPNIAVTMAGKPHWDSSDRWLPTDEDMRLLLNSMLHAAVSVNVASTMSLESFALGLPTINVAFRSRDDIEDHSLMWSFSMYHTSDHYRAIVDNGAVDLARSMDELIAFTEQALLKGNARAVNMQKTLELKAAYCDGTSARRFVEIVEGILEPEKQLVAVSAPSISDADEGAASPVPHASPAE